MDHLPLSNIVIADMTTLASLGPDVTKKLGRYFLQNLMTAGQSTAAATSSAAVNPAWDSALAGMSTCILEAAKARLTTEEFR